MRASHCLMKNNIHDSTIRHRSNISWKVLKVSEGLRLSLQPQWIKFSHDYSCHMTNIYIHVDQFSKGGSRPLFILPLCIHQFITSFKLTWACCCPNIYRSCSHGIYRTNSKYLVLQLLFHKYISSQQLGKGYWLYVNSKWISLNSSLIYLSDKIVVPLEINNYDHQYGNDSIDPNLNYFRSFNQYISHSNYLVESSFNSEIYKCSKTKQHFSICHLKNARSIRKNLDSFEMLLKDLQHEYSLISVT